MTAILIIISQTKVFYNTYIKEYCEKMFISKEKSTVCIDYRGGLCYNE